MDSDAIPDTLARPTAPDDGQLTMFDIEPDWSQYWWGMPAYTMQDALPRYCIKINFLTSQDIRDFSEKVGLRVTTKSHAAWFPPVERLKRGQFVWRGTPSPTRYPVYIPSKGRADVGTTGALLRQAGVNFHIVVEPQEEDAYRAKYGDSVLVLPFANLGQGSIPARNWIWEHAIERGAPWHWIIDDNIGNLFRMHHNRRILVRNSSAPFRLIEDFSDRFSNLAFSGMQGRGFGHDRNPLAPITFNSRVYSVTLINTSLQYRWRGRYNEDTDICLRALKDGWVTASFRAFLAGKTDVNHGDGSSGMKGGNTDNVYKAGDYRRAFAESLREQHPDVIKVVWKFGRWHHQVDYSPFKKNKLILKPGITPHQAENEYGLKLVKTGQ